MNPAIARCLGGVAAAAPAVDDVAQWLPQWRAVAAAHAAPFDRAVAGGFAADRVGWAFASGYQAALRALVPGRIADGVVAALCVTEEGGNRPRDIATTIELQHDGGLILNGAKRWTTLGPDSALLLVAGRVVGCPAERPQLRVALVPSDAPGVALTAMAPTRFVPEVPHARVALANVRLAADALLPGDGYDDCVKPFRTIEDTQVTAAILAYLLREARSRGWPPGFRERIVATLQVLGDVAAGAADAPSNHVLLAGALRWAQALYAEADALWTAAGSDGDDPAARRWKRDAALFSVAATARKARAARAWERLDGSRGVNHE